MQPVPDLPCHHQLVRHRFLLGQGYNKFIVPPGPNGGALSPQAAAALVSGLQGLGGTTVYPIWSLPQAANPNH
jgi:hypothetical protein